MPERIFTPPRRFFADSERGGSAPSKSMPPDLSRMLGQVLSNPQAMSLIRSLRRSMDAGSGSGGGADDTENDPAGDTPGGYDPGGDGPAGDGPGGDTPGGNDPGGNDPGGNDPGGYYPGGFFPGRNRSAGDSPAEDGPAGDSGPGGGLLPAESGVQKNNGEVAASRPAAHSHEERVKLLHALRPYLGTERRQKIDRIIQLMELLRAAQTAGIGGLLGMGANHDGK